MLDEEKKRYETWKSRTKGNKAGKQERMKEGKKKSNTGKKKQSDKEGRKITEYKPKFTSSKSANVVMT